MNNFIQKRIMPPMMKFLNFKAVIAIKNGMLIPIPFIIVGAIFLIFASFPLPAVATFLTNTGWAAIFNQTYQSSFGILGLIAAFGVGYSYVKEEGLDAAPAGITSVIVSFIMQPHFAIVTNIADPTKSAAGWQATSALQLGFLGSKGMILSIIAGLLVGWSYSWLVKKKVTIKLPEMVPANVSASFTALVPAFLIILVSTFIYALTIFATKITPIEWIYNLIQTPLQHVVDGPAGVFMITFLIPFIWWFGVHGASIIQGIMMPLLLANNADNLKLFQAHHLDMAHGAHIVTLAFFDQFCTVTGSGMTIGVVIYMLFRAKSVQMKTIVKSHAKMVLSLVCW